MTPESSWKQLRDPILLATTTFGKWGETNGVFNTYRQLADEFRRADIPLHIVTYGPEDGDETDGSVTVSTHRPRVPIKVDHNLVVDSSLVVTPTQRKLLGKRYSLVHSATPDFLGRLAYRVAQKNDCPFVTGYHTSLHSYALIRGTKLYGENIGKLSHYAMMKWMQDYFNKSDLILAPSETTMTEITDYFSPRIGILSRGVDIQRFNPSFRDRDQTTIPTTRTGDDISVNNAWGKSSGFDNGDEGHEVRAVYVGRVSPEKNLKLLVDVFSELKEATLTVVGDGTYLKEMERLLPDAEFTGKLKGEALSRAYANGDLFVFPSKTETFGNVALEAMSSGLPVVVTDSGAPKELVEHGTTGYIADSDEAFRNAIGRLAVDASLRKRMGSAARAYAETRSWKAVFESLLESYGTVMEDHG